MKKPEKDLVSQIFDSMIETLEEDPNFDKATLDTLKQLSQQRTLDDIDQINVAISA
jgi:hypothetical protein